MRRGRVSDDDDDDIPVGELSDEDGAPPVAGGRRSRRLVVAVVAVSLVTVGAAFALRVANDHRARRGVVPAIRTVNGDRARVDVLAALRATKGSGSFTFHFRLSESSGTESATTSAVAPCSSAPTDTAVCGNVGVARNVTITGGGTINVDPLVMVSTSNVPGLGDVTVRVNGTDVWEQGGGNYGTLLEGSASPGAPLSGFAGLVLGTLGQREGAIAMNSMASPTGYLDLAEQAITDTSKLGDSVVGGVPVQEYEVTIDATKTLDRPGLTAEEMKTAIAALAVLQREGYQTTKVRLSVDAFGFIRAAYTVVSFADGGTVTADTTFSGFGCSTTVQRADGPAIVPVPGGCASPGQESPSTTVTTVPAQGCRNSSDPACGPFRYDPPLTDAPAKLEIVKVEPATPKAGDTVTFTLHATDPDSFIASGGFCGGASYGDGEASKCGPSCAGTGPQFGPWDPPPARPGDSTFTVSHAYAKAGSYTANFSITADQCGPRSSDASASISVQVSP